MPWPAAVQPFVGREQELAQVEEALCGAGGGVVFIHGPGGIGKSALLREVGSRAQGRGLEVRWVDGREGETAAAELRAICEEMRDGTVGLLALDTYERVPALGSLLRRELPACLAAGGRAVIAGRRPPEPEWARGGWSGVLRPLALKPLSDEDCAGLLRMRGLGDEESIARVIEWAEGSPLATTVAGDSLLAGNELNLDDLDADQLLGQALIAHLAGDELEGADRDVVAVAAIARAVDAQLLAAALPGIDGDHAEAWLRSLSFAEPLGTRVTLHERVRRAARGALLQGEPEHERQLRSRIADHLYARAGLGDLRLLADLAELIENPTVRWGIAPPPVSVRADRLQGGDAERLREMLGAEGKSWWAGVERWLSEAPEHVIVIRDAAGELVGWRIWVTPARAPAWVHEDAILGPWLADARERAPDGDALLLRDGSDLVREPGGAATSPVVSAANYASVLGSGLRSVRFMYATTDPGDRQIHDFLLAMGYQRQPQLDVVDGERTVPSYVVDWGAGGVVRAVRDLVYWDTGRAPPAADEPPDALAASQVRDALRSFHDPVALASSPLARGAGAGARAEAVRKLLRGAVDSAFGSSPEEELLRQTVRRGYLDPEGGHARAMQELNVSRTTYFRRLAEASERVSRRLLEDRR